MTKHYISKTEKNTMTLHNIENALVELFKTTPVSDKEYWFNIMNTWSPEAKRIFDEFIKEKAKKFNVE